MGKQEINDRSRNNYLTSDFDGKKTAAFLQTCRSIHFTNFNYLLSMSLEILTAAPVSSKTVIKRPNTYKTARL